GMVKMANLSVIGSKKINGVSALHSEIIKQSIFKDFNDIYPERFTNVTNGIAYRRWLCQSNPELTSLISDCIGDGFIKDASLLANFKDFENDQSVLKRMNEIKLIRKKKLADYLRSHQNINLDPNTLFDVQAKRLHEYKRQLLNVLQIISLYEDLKENPDLNIQPQTFIFGAKAASGYYMAKQIIKLICYLAEDINKNPDKRIREKLKVAYIENYSVTIAELLMPATEVSEQISQAGKEASGTGNMKFMINGALTLGTMDGANVEMHGAVGDENIYIFGLRSNEVETLWKEGYNSTKYYNANPKLKRVIQSLKLGFNGESFANIADYLLTQYPVADPYMCMADFADYDATRSKILCDYSDKILWATKSLRNVAASGIFSSDRSIREYAENIWDLKPIK
ncbi:MAG: glycogen/starch/alpha-glucan phosphorylase, partial [Clostridia bacterium]|nr:glycogen/starch/alpha-glucan phosphorylase [Clostridia bacterium]